jgi:hypothetical protein
MENIWRLLTPVHVIVSWGGVRVSPLGTSATNWPIIPAPDDRWRWMWSSRWNENCHRKPKYFEKTCPNACSVKCIPQFGARQRLSKHVSAATNTCYNRRIVGRVVFYAVRVVSNKNKRLVLPRTSWFTIISHITYTRSKQQLTAVISVNYSIKLSHYKIQMTVKRTWKYVRSCLVSSVRKLTGHWSDD